MSSNQFRRGGLPDFRPYTMARHSDGDVPMTERPSIPSISSIEHQRSRSLSHQTSNVDRPNMVLSGHRKFNRAFYTGPRANMESHANRIVAKLEENEALMDDSPVSEQLRKEALRDLPQCLTMKRCVKTKLSKSVSQKSKRKPIGFWKRCKYRISIGYSKFLGNLKNFNYFELWQGTLKDIEGRFGSGYASYFKFLRWLFVMNFVVALLPFCLLVLPQIIYDTHENQNNTQNFQFGNIFVGDGFFEETILYYGHYTNDYITAIPHLTYDMPSAYFSVTVILYLLCFVVLAVSVAELYRRTYIETEGGLQNVYANRVFCGWDYAIATAEAANLKSSAIYHELKELLSEELQDEEERSCLYKFWTYSIQVVVNLLILVILAGVGWLTWLLLNEFSGRKDAIVVTTVVINIIIMVVPTVFSYISKYEDYKNPRTALYITLTRTYLLGAVIIGVIFTFWLIRAINTQDCWENGFSAEIYRLVMFDFLFSVLLTAIIDVGYFIGRYFLGYEPKSEFNVAKHTLQIVYNQGLFWVGFFYSPILPAIVTLKMFIIWYVREGCVRKLCKPPTRTWRAAQAQTWFMMMTFVSILLIIAVQGYTMTSVQSSSTCGPFQDYKYTYEILTNNIANLKEHEFWRVILNVTKPGGVALIMIALIILVYYLREQAHAQKDKVAMFREMLIWVTKDKKFLVQWYNDVAKGEINPYLRDNRFVDPSKILPHEYVDERSSSIDDDEFNARFKKYT